MKKKLVVYCRDKKEIKKADRKANKKKKTALVLGAGGFIGSHLVTKLRKEGFWVRGVDLKLPEYSKTKAHDFVVGDLRDPYIVDKVLDRPFDEVYQLAADMGGAGFVFTGDNDADIMHNSALINLNIAKQAVKVGVKKLFYSSSACMYPAYNQTNLKHPDLSEASAYPAAPDSEYGWEKLFSERLYLAFHRNYGLNIRIARFHNVFGPEGTYMGGREKSPAAFCRKIALAADGDTIDMWGDGRQTRSYLYIDECLTGVRKLINSSFIGPVNIGSDEQVSINELVRIISSFEHKHLKIKHIKGPLGVRGRNSDNHLIYRKLHWKPHQPLKDGLLKTYLWICDQIDSVL
jgi:nucleoside-diphosphate-sugar epimerase